MVLDHYPPSQQTLECFASSVQSQFKLSGRGISDALLYTVLDTMGETEFGKLSEDNHLSQDTRERIQEYWSVDNLQIQVSTCKYFAIRESPAVCSTRNIPFSEHTSRTSPKSCSDIFKQLRMVR